MKQKRPVNLNLATIKFPVTAISSIFHRISGVLLFLSIPLLMWILQLSLTPSGFGEVKAILSSGIAKFLLWAFLTMLAYHIFAGIRHLFLDAGIGESHKAGRATAYTVMILGVTASALIGVWLW